MARIRTIKPGFFKNEDIAALPAMARLLFIGLWTQADRAGRLEDRPKRLKAEIFPYESYDIEKGLNELQNAKFILRYKVNVNVSDRVLAPEQPVTELALIQIKNFTVHQQPNIKEAQSTLPAPNSNRTSKVLASQEQEGNMEQEGNGENAHTRNDEPEELPPKNNIPPPVAPPPSISNGPPIEEVKMFFSGAGGTDEMAEAFWNKWEGFGWQQNNTKIKNWRPFGNNFIATWYRNEKEKKHGSSTGRQSVSGSIEGINAAFADVQRDLDASMCGGPENQGD